MNATLDAFQTVMTNLIEVVQHTISWQGGIWLLTTILIYTCALFLHRMSRANPLLHPLTITATAVGALVLSSETTVADYQQYASLLHYLLGPATVALALPLHSQWHRVRELGWRLVVAIACGGVIAPVLAWYSVIYFDVGLALEMTMLVKSITTPLAMETAQAIGGVPALAAVFVIITGIVGAIVAPVTFRLLQVTMPQAQGVALGSVCHAVGTSKAIQMGEVTGAMASLGLCLNGIMTAFILPIILL